MRSGCFCFFLLTTIGIPSYIKISIIIYLANVVLLHWVNLCAAQPYIKPYAALCVL